VQIERNTKIYLNISEMPPIFGKTTVTIFFVIMHEKTGK